MKKSYQIEFYQDGGWFRAHHDFDEIEPEYTNKRKAQKALNQAKREYKYSFRLVER